MKASVEWLKEYSKIDVDTVKLGDCLLYTSDAADEL